MIVWSDLRGAVGGLFAVLLGLIPSAGQGARRITPQAAWDSADVVVRGEVVASRWLRRPSGSRGEGAVLYHVRVQEVWKGEATEWIQIVEPTCNEEGCCLIRPRRFDERARFFFFVSPGPESRYLSGAAGSCGLLKSDDAQVREVLAAHRDGPARQPAQGGQPPAPEVRGKHIAGEAVTGGRPARPREDGCGCGIGGTAAIRAPLLLLAIGVLGWGAWRAPRRRLHR